MVKKATRSRSMGRSRGGLTTKIHALVDAVGRPIRLKLTEGGGHDGRSAADMFETLGQGVNGGVKTSQVAAQKSATVDMACLSAV